MSNNFYFYGNPLHNPFGDSIEQNGHERKDGANPSMNTNLNPHLGTYHSTATSRGNFAHHGDGTTTYNRNGTSTYHGNDGNVQSFQRGDADANAPMHQHDMFDDFIDKVYYDEETQTYRVDNQLALQSPESHVPAPSNDFQSSSADNNSHAFIDGLDLQNHCTDSAHAVPSLLQYTTGQGSSNSSSLVQQAISQQGGAFSSQWSSHTPEGVVYYSKGQVTEPFQYMNVTQQQVTNHPHATVNNHFTTFSATARSRARATAASMVDRDMETRDSSVFEMEEETDVSQTASIATTPSTAASGDPSPYVTDPSLTSAAACLQFLHIPDACYLILVEIENDDWQDVKANRVDHFVGEIYNALFSDYAHTDPAGKEINANATYFTTQARELKKIKADLHTPLMIERANKRCYLMVDAAIAVHEKGFNKGVYDTFKSTKGKKRECQLDLTSICSARLALIVEIVKRNKLVAKDILSGTNLDRIAQDPWHYLWSKHEYACSNLLRQKRTDEHKKIAETVAQNGSGPSGSQ